MVVHQEVTEHLNVWSGDEDIQEDGDVYFEIQYIYYEIVQICTSNINNRLIKK